MPAMYPEPPLFDAWLKPGSGLTSTILAVNEQVPSVRPNDIDYLDKGSNDGIAPGDRFAVFARTDDALSGKGRTALGELQAVNVMPGQTAVIVTAMSDTRIGIGDRAELVARCRVAD
jgi:hypothetical protein